MERLLSLVRHNLTLRIGGVFLALLLITTILGVLTIRYYVQEDLEMGTRREMLHSMARMESELRKLQDKTLLFAKLSARAAQVEDTVGSRTLQIIALEESRSSGIEIDQRTQENPGEVQRGVLHRGFAGMSTVDYVLQGTGSGRFHIIAVAPLEAAGSGRRVIVSSMSLGREFLRQEREILGGDVSLLLQDEVIATTSTCAACMACLTEVAGDRSQWKVLESGKPIYYSFDCDPEPQAAILLPLRTFSGETVALALFRTRTSEMLALRHATLGALAGGGTLSLVMSGVFLFFTSRAIRPLREITRVAAKLGAG